LFSQSIGRLAAEVGKAVSVLGACLGSESELIRLQAAKAIVTFTQKERGIGDATAFPVNVQNLQMNIGGRPDPLVVRAAAEELATLLGVTFAPLENAEAKLLPEKSDHAEA
jgi:hypothetical protein